MDINLRVLRQLNTPISAVGQWSLGGHMIDDLFSLEDTDRNLTDDMTEAAIKKIKVYGETAIPTTVDKPYRILLDKSNRFTAKFGRDMYMLRVQDPKGFDGILIHPGNTSADFLGCIGVGKSKDVNFIGASRPGYVQLLNLVKDTLGFTFIMAGTMPILVPIKDFKPSGTVYLDVKRNYTL